MDARSRSPRLRRPEQSSVLPHAVVEELLPQDHQAREVVQHVGSLDLSKLLAPIRAVEGGVGRNATDPAALLSLWMYAVLDGVGSARRLAKLVLQHSAYRWSAGGMTFCHRLPSSFRSSNGELFDDLVGDPVGPDRRAREAQNRRPDDRLERLRRAKAAAEELTQKRTARVERMPAEAKHRKSTGEARASATDPDALRMKMPVRGVEKARAAVALHVLVHNMRDGRRLRSASAA